MRYAVCVAGFLSLFGIAWQIVYPPRYPYIDSAAAAFLLSSLAILLSIATAVRSYQFFESDACSSSVRM